MQCDDGACVQFFFFRVVLIRIVQTMTRNGVLVSDLCLNCLSRPLCIQRVNIKSWYVLLILLQVSNFGFVDSFICPICLLPFELE